MLYQLIRTCLRCGSNVADKNPMLMEVTIILAAANITPGIFNTFSMLAVKFKI